ncbi:hypothetical protein ACJMK2_006673 [Sinanodonta woodiana]|uniref:M-phase inducer phosphatase n=1 Tax=Sinanodonta woodiana TaxID=1069815 RepID=A0ABD3VTX8_SINWO
MPIKGEDDIKVIGTPYFKGGNSIITCDEDSGLGCDEDKDSPFVLSCSARRDAIVDNVARSKAYTLSPAERPLTETYTPVLKKSRDSNVILDDRDVNVEEYACSTRHKSTIDAVDRLSDKPDLTADGSRPYRLPTIPGRHRDLTSISCHTMAALVRGTYSDEIKHFTIIDCRYPYEYNGGHIKGAVNMYRREEIQELLHSPRVKYVGKNGILIFHCEFSSERGPKLYRFLRGLDRNLHKENYPQLHYPEVYLLDGGYKAFFESYKELCEPIHYTPMLHTDHSEDLRHFRVKSKSWAAGETRRQYRQALRF